MHQVMVSCYYLHSSVSQDGCQLMSFLNVGSLTVSQTNLLWREACSQESCEQREIGAPERFLGKISEA